jgi:hypothetical protein
VGREKYSPPSPVLGKCKAAARCPENAHFWRTAQALKISASNLGFNPAVRFTIVDRGSGNTAAVQGIAAERMGRTLAAGASPPWEVVEMGIMEFEVCRRGRDARWVVRIGDSVYGAYLDKEQALLDAVDAARDALQSGRDAQVWIRERASSARIF